MLDHSAGGVAGQQRVFGQFHARRGAVAQPLFRHECRAKLAALGDRQMSGRVALDDDGAGVLRQSLPRKCCEQLVLAVAGDAGDAQDFTTLQLQRDVLEPDAMRIVRLEVEIVDHEARHRDLPPGGGLHLLDVGADHHARQRRRGLKLRIAGRDLLAAAQDGGGVAQPLHLFQLVADVEDGAAFRLQPLQHDEELVGLLRRQHRGRLVEDQEFRVLHQRADDFDALALAHREPPHLAPGIERKPVNVGYLLQPRRHVLEGFLAVEAERHVLRDREIVEQRKMLEHHADAARARFRRARRAPFSRPASAFRLRSAGSGRRWF